MIKGIQSKKDLDAFVARMAAGRSSAAKSRASSNAPPSPPAKAKPSPTKLNAVKAPATKLPEPAKSTGRKKVPVSDATRSITINIRNH